MKDLSAYLPDEHVEVKPEVIFILKEQDGSTKQYNGIYNPKTWGHESMKGIIGGLYNIGVETKAGWCMSPLVATGRNKCIVGFHLGGSLRSGASGSLTYSQFEEAYAQLHMSKHCLELPSEGDMKTSQGGANMQLTPTTHWKSCMQFISHYSNMALYGSCAGRSTPTSTVCPTVISHLVSKICGVPQMWDKPTFKAKDFYPYQVAANVLSHPSICPGSVFEKAMDSCWLSFVEAKKLTPSLFTQPKLTEKETVNGIPGRKFCDPMAKKTSGGHGYGSPKSKHMTKDPPDPLDPTAETWSFLPHIWQDAYNVANTLRQGLRAYVIWLACLKDEPTLIGQLKVRVFQCAPLPLQLLLRMYFLPIVMVIQSHPLLFECMVGVNCEGPEWEQMHAHTTSMGENVFAGDYSKYDQRMPGCVTMGAFQLLIRCAEEFMPYTADDLKIMAGVAAEVCNPVVALNGDLVQFFGSNPSGQNLTAIINSLGNSLLMRCCYFSIYPNDTPEDFQRYVKVGTYGDDFKGTVSTERPLFNHISYAAWLASHDMKLTMPDKKSTPTAYMCDSDADFLKRKNFYNPDLECNVGLLDEMSIFKRLHSHNLSTNVDLSLPLQSAQNIDSSLHDWFYYGREMYEMRQRQMIQIAEEAGISLLCVGLYKTYDQRVQRWKNKYRPLEVVDLESFEPEDLDFFAGIDFEW
jgi:hypothetical protein